MYDPMNNNRNPVMNENNNQNRTFINNSMQSNQSIPFMNQSGSNEPWFNAQGSINKSMNPTGSAFTQGTSTINLNNIKGNIDTQRNLNYTDYENEPPLLEELGINFAHIWFKTQSVLIPTKQINDHILDDTDLAGPLVFCFIFGLCLLFAGKIHFGYIYGFGVMGCLFIYLLTNLMSSTRSIDIYRVCSVLGYCLLPIIGLAAVNILYSVKSMGLVGFIIAFICILWSTYTASRFFEKVLHMTDQRYLIAYPLGLVYSCFILITVF